MPKPEGNRKKIKGAGGSRAAAAAAAGAGGSKSKAKRKGSKGAAKQAMSAAQLYEAAQAALAVDEYERALECLRDALQLEPENLELLDAHGALLAELGRTEEAVAELQRAVALSPEEGFEKYMYLGQLLEGEQALAASQKGVELLQLDVSRAQQEGGDGDAAARALSKQLAAALCSLAEMQMSHAEDVAAVSGAAEALLQRAQAADPGSPEPLQALASLRYEQGDAEGALQLLRQSMGLWFRPQGQSDDEDAEAGDEDEQLGKAGSSGDGEFRIPIKPVTMSEEMDEEQQQQQQDDDDGEWVDADEDEDDDDGVPSYEFRFECAKMLLELDESTDTAIQVLEDLIAENDSVLDVWHLLGLAYYSGGQLEEAAEVCKAGQALMEKQGVGAGEDIAACFDDLASAIADAQQVLGGDGGGQAAAADGGQEQR